MQARAPSRLHRQSWASPCGGSNAEYGGELGTHAQRLLRLDRRLVALAVELDDLLTRGVGWHGIAIEPPMLRGHLTYIWAQIDELERARARVRSMPARGATERIRETVEEAIVVMRRAFIIYFDGSVSAYREAGGASIEPGATGRDPSAALIASPASDELPELRKSMELAIRTVAYQLDADRIAETYRCRWPATRTEVAVAETDLWAAEPRPLMHETDPDEPGVFDA